MARDGSGTYNLTSGNPVITETVVSSATFNNTMLDLAAALTQSISKDGQTVPTGEIPMGGFKHTSVADGSAINHYATVGQLQKGSPVWAGTNGGSANAITIQIFPGQPSYTAGELLHWVAAITNTGPVTLNRNGLGVRDLVKFGAKPLQASDLKAALHYSAIYDGTRFQLLNPSANQPTAGDQLWYGSADGVWAQTPLTSAGRAIIGSGAPTLKLLIDVQVFTGSGTWTNPPGATLWKTRGVGGGAAGGGTQATGGSQYATSGGGGSAGYVEETLTSGVGATEAITIGAGGAAAAGANGGNGGSTSFGSHWTAGGGLGGIVGTATAVGTLANSAGGNAGTATGGQINSPGQAGGHSYGIVADGTTVQAVSGEGGGSNLGSGGRNRSFSAGNPAGLAGTAYGGGGGGTTAGTSAAALAGGAGAPGILIVESYA